MKLKSWLKELPYTLLQGSLETEVDEVVYDSRKAAPGTVFVCMRCLLYTSPSPRDCD